MKRRRKGSSRMRSCILALALVPSVIASLANIDRSGNTRSVAHVNNNEWITILILYQYRSVEGIHIRSFAYLLCIHSWMTPISTYINSSLKQNSFWMWWDIHRVKEVDVWHNGFSYVWLSLFLSVWLSLFCPFDFFLSIFAVCLTFCLFEFLSVSLSVCVTFCLSVCLTL